MCPSYNEEGVRDDINLAVTKETFLEKITKLLFKKHEYAIQI